MNIYSLFPMLVLLLLVSVSGYVLAEENKTNVSPIIFSVPDKTALNTGGYGHDYVLQKATLAGDYSTTRPGRSVNPSIIVYNQGGDDTAPGNVPVEAWLGDTKLIPVHGEFIPLKGGTSAMYTLRYMIPQDIPLMPAHLTMKIDPWNTRQEVGTGTNDFTTLALVVIEDRNNKWDDF